jgi:hypothetical protein
LRKKVGPRLEQIAKTREPVLGKSRKWKMAGYSWQPLIRLTVVPDGAAELIYVFSDRARASEMVRYLSDFFPGAQMRISETFN